MCEISRERAEEIALLTLQAVLKARMPEKTVAEQLVSSSRVMRVAYEPHQYSPGQIALNLMILQTARHKNVRETDKNFIVAKRVMFRRCVLSAFEIGIDIQEYIGFGKHLIREAFAHVSEEDVAQGKELSYQLHLLEALW